MLALNQGVRALGAIALAAALSSSAFGADYIGLELEHSPPPSAPDWNPAWIQGHLRHVDANGVVTQMGTLVEPANKVVFQIASSDDGTLYGLYDDEFSVWPEPAPDYSVCIIDRTNYTLTPIQVTGGSPSLGNAGFAVDPSGNSLWVIGYGAALESTVLHEIDLATGVRTDHPLTGLMATPSRARPLTSLASGSTPRATCTPRRAPTARMATPSCTATTRRRRRGPRSAR